MDKLVMINACRETCAVSKHFEPNIFTGITNFKKSIKK